MKILWKSNAPWVGTGYGVQTRLMLRALKDLGHDPEAFCYYGLMGGFVTYDGYRCWPGSEFDAWGSDIVNAHVKNSEAEVLVTLMDLFVLKVHEYKKLKVPWLAWTPIDAEEIDFPNLQRLKYALPVAMSNFGAEQMMAVDIEPIDVIYHAVDTEVMAPMDKSECRKEFNIEEDCYLVGMVMANKGDRKQFPAQLWAISQWMKKNQDRNIRIYLHTDPSTAMGGWGMKALIKKLGLTGKVYATSQYFTSIIPIDPSQLARLYNCFDVLMNVSAGEGFGVPIVEAQSCGVPVITGNYTSMPELTHNGYCVEPATRELAFQLAWQYKPSVEDMVYRLESTYRVADKTKSLLGREWVIANCSVPVIADRWHNLLKRVADGN